MIRVLPQPGSVGAQEPPPRKLSALRTSEPVTLFARVTYTRTEPRMHKRALSSELAANSVRRLIPAILVHLYTSIGCLFGLLAIIATSRQQFSQAFSYLAVATWIDYTDGTLARRYRVWELLPAIDGALLDRVVDFLVVVVLPILLLIQSGLMPHPNALWITGILGVALFRFSRTFDPWIADGFNWGLPAFWLFPVYYIFFLRPPAVAACIFLALVGVLGCLPIGHIHPAIFPGLRVFNGTGLISWWLIYVVVTQGLVSNPVPWVLASLWYPLAYLVLSWITFRRYLQNQMPIRNPSRG